VRGNQWEVRRRHRLATFASGAGAHPPLDKVLDALTSVETGGEHHPGSALGPQTKYGRARGSTQLMADTAKGMAAKLGVPFRPDLLHSNDPAALHYQRQLAGAYLQEGLDKTGNLIDALHYYHGGPDRSIWGPKTRAYADAVIGRLGGQQ
jgi:soluble lytic murein transglycosylase-like protein